MLRLLLALLCATAEAQTASVRGRVIDATSGEPVRKAWVVLSNGSNLSATGNAEGWFEISNVEAGSYSVSASAPGYLSGPGLWSNPGDTRLSVPASGLPKPLLIRLQRKSRISGRVTDIDGDPVGEGMVFFLRRGIRHGREIWVSSGETEIDVRGEFRSEAIGPGRYLLLARAGFAEGRAFYPDVNSAERATPIDIAPGEQRRGVDITIREVAGQPVSGALQGLPDARAYSLALVSSSSTEISGAGQFGFHANLSEDGRFSFKSIPEGVYRAELTHRGLVSSVCASGLALGLQKEENLVLTCNPPRTHPLDIRVLDEANSPLPTSGVYVSCLGDGAGIERWSIPVTANEDGVYRLPGLPERDCELSVRRGQRNLPVTGFRLRGPQVAGNLVGVPAGGTVIVSVVASTRPLSGVVAVDQPPSDFLEIQDHGHAVLIVPDRPALRGRASWRIVPAAVDGAFACADCPAIRSRALAIPNDLELQEELATDPGLLSQLLANAPIVDATARQNAPLKLAPVTTSQLQTARDRAKSGGARR